MSSQFEQLEGLPLPPVSISPFDEIKIAGSDIVNGFKSAEQFSYKAMFLVPMYISRGIIESIGTVKNMVTNNNIFPWEHLADSFKMASFLPNVGVLNILNPPRSLVQEIIEKRRMSQSEMLTLYAVDKIVPLQILEKLKWLSQQPELLCEFVNLENSIFNTVEEYLKIVPLDFCSDVFRVIAITSLSKSAESQLAAIGIGGAYALYGGRASAKRFDIQNHLGRIEKEFALLLSAFNLQYSNDLASTDTSVHSSVDIANKIFRGAKSRFSDIDNFINIVATLTGYSIGTAINMIRPENRAQSLSDALTFVAGLFGLTVYFKHKLNDGFGKKYQIHQGTLESRSKSALQTIEYDRGILKDDTLRILDEMRARRESLVNFINDVSNTRSERITRSIPWFMSLARLATRDISLAGSNVVLSALVETSILLEIFGAFMSQSTRDGEKRLSTDACKLLGNSIDKIFSDYRAYSRAYAEMMNELRLDDKFIASAAEIDENLSSSLNINLGLLEVYNKTIYYSESELSLRPGRVHLITAENSGTGKSTFARILIGNFGQSHRDDIYTALGEIDICRIHPNDRNRLFTYCEATPAQVSIESYKQLSRVFSSVRLSELFTTYLNQFGVATREGLLAPDYINSFITSIEHSREDNPLTQTLYEFFKIELNFKWKSIGEFVKFLKRIPGSEKGTSDGEAARLEIALHLLSKSKVLIFDEPTANLDGATGTILLDSFQRYVTLDRNAILIVISNQSSTSQQIRESDRFGINVHGVTQYSVKDPGIAYVIWSQVKQPLRQIV